MASFVAVVVGFFGGGGFFWGGRGCYVLFKKGFVLFVCLFVCLFVFSFFDGKSVMSALCIYYHMCMFV